MMEKTEVHINCSYDDTSLLLMLWYQQKKDNLSLIGYGYAHSDPTYDGQFGKQFKMTKVGTTGALTLLSADLSDSAVYFCAASTQ